MADRSVPETGLEDATVLVTGGAGFIGSHLTAALAAENEVRVLDDCSTGTASKLPDGATLLRADVRDETALDRAMAGVDVVFHLAAVVSVEQSVEDPVESHAVNVDGTLAVLERARREDARVVLASSAAVYGEPTDLPVDETADTDPLSPYGADKLAADSYARVYADVYDLPVAVMRFFNVYGPGQRGPYSGVVDAFLQRAFADEPLVVHGDGEQTRDFVHVSDVVRALVAAASTAHTGLAYNVGSGESASINELAAAIREATGTTAEITHGSARPGDIRHSLADCDRMRERLGVEPTVSLREGIEHLVAYRRGRGVDSGDERSSTRDTIAE
ncbi:NAD-dependent epimerase/dehydratase family protein [Halobellus rufus]|uniref:NAD-dependent epimerase/dehydratase family protein n=1 Tax=Halobellus rufus TaxID=1448860 RepID=UPI000678A5F7|nr:NAD-dependent epimerase/dehydratase family protein [Halobellus rufus]